MRLSLYYLRVVFFSFIILCYGAAVNFLYANISEPLDSIKTNSPAEEIPMQVNIEKIGSININVFANENDVYIPLSELFKSLKIDCNLSKGNLSAKGFFIKEGNSYSINADESWIELKGTKKELPRSDFYVNDEDLFMKSSLYKEFFDMDLNIDMKRLSIYMKSRETLPITLEEERKYLREKNEPKNSETKLMSPAIPCLNQFSSATYLHLKLEFSQSADLSLLPVKLKRKSPPIISLPSVKL